MKETIAGVILLILFILLSVWLGGNIQPDLTGDGGYEPSGGNGHPLWND